MGVEPLLNARNHSNSWKNILRQQNKPKIFCHRIVYLINVETYWFSKTSNCESFHIIYSTVSCHFRKLFITSVLDSRRCWRPWWFLTGQAEAFEAVVVIRSLQIHTIWYSVLKTQRLRCATNTLIINGLSDSSRYLNNNCHNIRPPC